MDDDSKGPETPEEAKAGKVDFFSFILSLSTSVLVNLGDVPDPVSGSTEKNVEMARQTIDVLNILEEKTRGNLSEEEVKLFEHVLPDLKMRYLKAIRFLS